MQNELPQERDAMPLERAIATFLDSLTAKNRSHLTIRAYRTDLVQFAAHLTETNIAVITPQDITREDVLCYLADLGRKGLSGVARARKLAAIREFFRYLEGAGTFQKSPTAGIDTPKRERNSRQYLRPDEFSKMLSLAGSSPRDYAILQVFLQTGVRVSELADLRLSDIDLGKPAITVRGKGNIERDIALEKRGVQALKNYLAARPQTITDRVFLNYQGSPISERGIRKLVVKYTKEAGITRRASCHTLRHTFATQKAEKGVSPFQLQQWLGHANLNTTQIYVHMGKQSAKKIMGQTSLA
jgi:site-specific recombinase XerD